jgi:hypothetical protein
MTTTAKGSRKWWVNGQLHRTTGPSVEYANGTRVWWVNDQMHRTTGPACEYADGTCEWWVNGQQVDEGTVKLMQFLQEKIK